LEKKESEKLENPQIKQDRLAYLLNQTHSTTPNRLSETALTMRPLTTNQSARDSGYPSSEKKAS